MRYFLRLLLPACLAATAFVVTAAPASGSEPLADANVTLASLKVNGRGEALVTYEGATAGCGTSSSGVR